MEKKMLYLCKQLFIVKSMKHSITTISNRVTETYGCNITQETLLILFFMINKSMKIIYECHTTSIK